MRPSRTGGWGRVGPVVPDPITGPGGPRDTSKPGSHREYHGDQSVSPTTSWRRFLKHFSRMHSSPTWHPVGQEEDKGVLDPSFPTHSHTRTDGVLSLFPFTQRTEQGFPLYSCRCHYYPRPGPDNGVSGLVTRRLVPVKTLTFLVGILNTTLVSAFDSDRTRLTLRTSGVVVGRVGVKGLDTSRS